MEELWVIQNGRRRRANKAICEYCNKTYLKRKNKQQKFCSYHCQGKARRKRIKTKCQQCGAIIEKPISRWIKSKNKIFFCTRKCKDMAQSLEGNCPEIRPKHYKNGYYIEYRKKLDFTQGCVGCANKRKYLLVAHHIDGNRENNKKTNIELVCSNCHRKRHLKKVKGEWVFDSNFLTPRNHLPKL